MPGTDKNFQGMGSVKEYYLDNPNEFITLTDMVNKVDSSMAELISNSDEILEVLSVGETGLPNTLAT